MATLDPYNYSSLHISLWLANGLPDQCTWLGTKGQCHRCQALKRCRNRWESGHKWVAAYRSEPVLSRVPHVTTCLEGGCVRCCSYKAYWSMVAGCRPIFLYFFYLYNREYHRGTRYPPKIMIGFGSISIRCRRQCTDIDLTSCLNSPNEEVRSCIPSSQRKLSTLNMTVSSPLILEVHVVIFDLANMQHIFDLIYRKRTLFVAWKQRGTRTSMG